MNTWMKASRSATALTGWDAIAAREKGSRGKPRTGFHRLPHSLGNLAKTARFPLFHRADNGFCHIETEGKNQNQTQGGGLNGRIALFHKADRSRVNQTGHLDLLTTAGRQGVLGVKGSLAHRTD